MNQTQFLKQLEKVKKSYKWRSENGKIIGTARNGKDAGKDFDVLEALERTVRHEVFVSNGVANALKSKSNRGYAPVLKGRVKSALGI